MPTPRRRPRKRLDLLVQASGTSDALDVSMSALPSSPSTIDQLAAQVAQPAEVSEALGAAVTAFRELTDQCQRHAIDPMTLLATMMRGETIANDYVAAPLVFDPARSSRDFIDAYDRADVCHVEQQLASAFVFFDGTRVQSRTAVLAALLDGSRQPPAEPRTWLEHHVMDLGSTVIVIAKVQEVPAGNETHGGYLRAGWFLFQWTKSNNVWALNLVTWQNEIASRAYFEDIFRKDRGFSHDPNELLAEIIATTEPGAALDVAMGQGRNALHLASKGWQVTGVDESDEGLRLATAQALQRDLTIDTVHADLDAWDMGDARFDLVTLIYAGDHGRWLERIKRSLRPGGWFVVEGWARVEASDTCGFAEGQLRQCFSDYEIVRDETLEARPDWAHDKGKLVRFVARKRAS